MRNLSMPNDGAHNKPTLVIATGGTIGSRLGGVDGTKGYVRSLNETPGHKISEPSASRIDQNYAPSWDGFKCFSAAVNSIDN